MNRTCPYCNGPAVNRTGNQVLCVMHYRLRDMRSKAKQNGKSVPSKEELSRMATDLVDRGMLCECCATPMTWLAQPGRVRVVSLQHDRDGGFRLICLLCNMRHYHVPGDMFYDIPDGYRWCAGCSAIVGLSEFTKDRTRRDGIRTNCKRCQGRQKAAWLAKNRKLASEYERLRRQRHRDEAKRGAAG